MNGTKIIDIHGKVKYIHAVNLNKYGCWSVTIYPIDKSLEIIRDLQSQGLKNVMKKDEDNQYFMQFKRDPTKLIKGKMVAFAAPKIVMHNPDDPLNPKLMDGSKVGWGSDVTVRLEVYGYGGRNGIAKAVAARWDSLKVLNLVEFEIDKSDWSEEDKENIKDLAKVPEPEPW